MNKSEAEDLGLLIAKIRIGDYRTREEIAKALSDLFPRAAQEADKYRAYVLFVKFREEADGVLSDKKFGNKWSIKKKDSDIGRDIEKFRTKYHASFDILQCVFEKYLEFSNDDFDGDNVEHVIDSNYWEAAKRFIEDDYGCDLRWLDV